MIVRRKGVKGDENGIWPGFWKSQVPIDTVLGRVESRGKRAQDTAKILEGSEP